MIILNVFMNAVAKARIFPVIFVKVEEAKVDEPTVKKLAATSVPVLVEEAVFRDKTDPFWAVKFLRVVDPKVDDPIVKKLPAVSVPVIVEDPLLSEVRFPF